MHLHFSILSGLKKTTAVVESLSTTSTRCSVTEMTSLLQDSTNRMRNLHQDSLKLHYTFSNLGDLGEQLHYLWVQLNYLLKRE